MGKPIAEIVQEGDRCLEVLDRVYRTTEAETHTESEHPGTHPAYWSYAIWPVLDGNQRSVGIVMQVTETTLFPADERNEREVANLFGASA